MKYSAFALLFSTTLSFKVSAQAELQDFLSGQVIGNEVFLEYDYQKMLDSITTLNVAVTEMNTGSSALTDLITTLNDSIATLNIASTAWSCGDAITYSGVGYSTVQIGDQCWFAENLRTTTYRNGDEISQGLINLEWSGTPIGAMAFYLDVPTNSGLYNWYAVDDARGLCPSGWHVPTDAEWTIMTDHLGGASVAGGQMKTTYGWYGDGNGTNSSGFSGLPGGSRGSNGDFSGAGDNGVWWSSSPNGSSAWYRYLSNDVEVVYRGYYDLRNGFSVRCVRDAE